jgi:hypothetical protein
VNPYEAPKSKKKKKEEGYVLPITLGASALGALALRHAWMSGKEADMLRGVISKDEEFAKGNASNTPQEAFDNYVRSGSTVLQGWKPLGVKPVTAIRWARSSPIVDEKDKWTPSSGSHYVQSEKGPLYQAVKLVQESNDARMMDNPESDFDKTLRYRLNLALQGARGDREKFDQGQFSDNIKDDPKEVEKAQDQFKQTIQSARAMHGKDNSSFPGSILSGSYDKLTDFKDFTNNIEKARDTFLRKSGLNEQIYSSLPYEDQYSLYKKFESDLAKTDPKLRAQYELAKFSNGTHYGMGAKRYAELAFKPALKIREMLGYGAAVLGVGAAGVLGYMLYKKLKKKS